MVNQIREDSEKRPNREDVQSSRFVLYCREIQRENAVPKPAVASLERSIAMKKFLRLGCVLGILTALLAGCGTKAPDLYEKGIEVITLMQEMAENETYLDACTASPEIRGALQGVGHRNPAEPTGVWEITIPEAKLPGMEGVGEMSPELKQYMRNRAYGTLASQINAMGGVQALAASNLCTGSVSFLNPGFQGNTLYLYLYENAAPVLVAFSAENDGIVGAAGTFLLNPDFAPENGEDVQTFFGELGAQVTERKP